MSNHDEHGENDHVNEHDMALAVCLTFENLCSVLVEGCEAKQKEFDEQGINLPSKDERFSFEAVEEASAMLALAIGSRIGSQIMTSVMMFKNSLEEATQEFGVKNAGIVEALAAVDVAKKRELASAIDEVMHETYYSFSASCIAGLLECDNGKDRDDTVKRVYDHSVALLVANLAPEDQVDYHLRSQVATDSKESND